MGNSSVLPQTANQIGQLGGNRPVLFYYIGCQRHIVGRHGKADGFVIPSDCNARSSPTRADASLRYGGGDSDRFTGLEGILTAHNGSVLDADIIAGRHYYSCGDRLVTRCIYGNGPNAVLGIGGQVQRTGKGSALVAVQLPIYIDLVAGNRFIISCGIPTQCTSAVRQVGGGSGCDGVLGLG